MTRLGVALVLVSGAGPVFANDGAAEVAAGGIQLRPERRVTMLKERLYISPEKVRVEYEFLNESTEDVKTEVAFPVPPYSWSPVLSFHDFRGFKAWVNDIDVPIDLEVKAFVGDRDVTRDLEKAGLEIATFGRQETHSISADGRSLEWMGTRPQAASLPAEVLADLVKKGLIEREKVPVTDTDIFPLWSVRATYHWFQHFPPGQVVRIRHEYLPAAGFQVGIRSEYLKDSCAEGAVRRLFAGPVHESGAAGSSAVWVKYILTTANTWKTPIRDFELTVERQEGSYVSFCWDGPVKKSGPRTFKAAMKDFVPSRELTVFFFRPKSS
jgi:hypothetical protein